MRTSLQRKSILHKTVQVGSLTFLSRILGLFREILLVRFLGVGAISDAFIVAWKIPNFLRKIFAEGALSAAFVPMFIKLVQEKRHADARQLISAAFLFFEGIVLLLWGLVLWQAPFIVRMIAPGFSAEQLMHTVPYLRILFVFIFCISSSALFAGALQAHNHFFIPAFSPVLLNISWICALIACLTCNLSVEWLCVGVIVGGVAQLLLHFVYFLYHGFYFERVTQESFAGFSAVLKKFGHCLFGVSIIELNLFVDTMVASFLPAGSVSLLEYGSRFMGIPLGVFAVAFSTILLSHFSRVALYAPRRMHYYVLESTKFVCWVVLPVSIFLVVVSEPLMLLLMQKNATAYQVWQGGWILSILVAGLVFFSLNKILANVFYAFHDTWTPTIAGAIATLFNFVFNVVSVAFLGKYAVFGIAGSTVLSGVVLTAVSFYFLHKKYQFRFYLGNLGQFLGRYVVQIGVSMLAVYTCFVLCQKYVHAMSFVALFEAGVYYWVLMLLVAAVVTCFLFFTKRLFNVKLYFL